MVVLLLLLNCLVWKNCATREILLRAVKFVGIVIENLDFMVIGGR